MSPNEADNRARKAFPRDRDELVRDFTVAGQLRDIRAAADLKERLAPRWWEPLVWMAQFAGALGLLGAVMVYGRLQGTQVGWLIFFFLLLFALSIVFATQFVLFKIYHLRRANALAVRLIDDLRDRIETLEAREREAASAGAAIPSTDNEDR